MHVQQHPKGLATVISPTFAYNPGACLNVEYSLRKVSTDMLAIKLFNTENSTETEVWQSTSYTIFGILHSCITLPVSLAMVEVQIKLILINGDLEWTDERDMITAFRSLFIDRNSCPGKRQ